MTQLLEIHATYIPRDSISRLFHMEGFTEWIFRYFVLRQIERNQNNKQTCYNQNVGINIFPISINPRNDSFWEWQNLNLKFFGISSKHMV